MSKMSREKIKYHMVRFLKIWFLLTASYIPLRIIYNLAFYGWLELRLFVAFEVILLPLGQAVVFWIITAPFARKLPAPPPTAMEP